MQKPVSPIPSTKKTPKLPPTFSSLHCSAKLWKTKKLNDDDYERKQEPLRGTALRTKTPPTTKSVRPEVVVEATLPPPLVIIRVRNAPAPLDEVNGMRNMRWKSMRKRRMSMVNRHPHGHVELSNLTLSSRLHRLCPVFLH